MKVERVGFFRELRHGDPNGESLKNIINNCAKADENKIIDYLKSGVVWVACGGATSDVLNPSNGIIGPPDILTDGSWVWPADLIYYVQQYHITLDENFINHIIKNNWLISRDEINLDNLEF